VNLDPAVLREWGRSDEGRKAIRYTLVSVISVAVSQSAFVIVLAANIFGSRGSSIFANFAGAVPSYYLNRHWAWAKSGRSHFMKEVVPFWALFVVGLVFSTWAADFAHTHAASLRFQHHVSYVLIVAAAYLGSFAVLWVGKFIFFNKVLWAEPSSGEAPDVRAGV
jgi:putative flippase GtrA